MLLSLLGNREHILAEAERSGNAGRIRVEELFVEVVVQGACTGLVRGRVGLPLVADCKQAGGWSSAWRGSTRRARGLLPRCVVVMSDAFIATEGLLRK